MKLNLLPTYVSKEKATRNAVITGIVLLVVCLGAAFLLYTKGIKDFNDSKEPLADAAGKAKKAKDTADFADTVMSDATGLLRNTELAKAMIKHNSAYPDLYDQIRRYIPSFYRVNNMSAAAAGPGLSSVQLVGVLDTYQQYADLMLAMLRIPGVQSVARSGFTLNNAYVPAPTPDDQAGRPHKPGEAPIPDDPLKKLEYLQAKGGVTGYTGTGGFGAGPGTRGAMPNESEVTVTLVIAYDLQTPDPAATLKQGGGAATTGGGGGATAPAGQGANNPRRGAAGGG